jgi:hypothetical protein
MQHLQNLNLQRAHNLLSGIHHIEVIGCKIIAIVAVSP